MKLSTYNSLQEKTDIFKERYQRIDAWPDLENLLKQGISTDCVFRGMNEAKYKNYTSVQRYSTIHELDKSGPSISHILQKEVEVLLTSNHNLINRYYDSLGVETNWFLLTSFLQHYGGNTPFLDFSKNMLVSLYFAQEGITELSEGKENIDNYCSLYYIKTEDIDTISSLLKVLVDKLSIGYEKVDQKLNEYKEKYPVLYKMTNDSLAPYRQNTNKLIDTFLSVSFYKWYEDLLAYCEDEDLLLLIDDTSICLDSDSLSYHKHVITAANLNLIAQEGVFVMRAGMKPLEKEHIHCIDIHKSLIPTIREYLKQKDISKESLFPQEEKIAEKALHQSLLFNTENE